MKTNVTKFNMDKFLQQKIKEERQEQIYEMVKLRSRVRKVNRALAALRKSGLYDESVAVENIFNYLESKAINVTKTPTGNISMVGLKSKSMTQMKGIEKAIEQSKNVDMLCFGETFLDLNENLMKKKDGLYYKLFMTQAKNYSN